MVRSAGNTRSSCQGVVQTRSSPRGAVSASAKTLARGSGSHSGVSLLMLYDRGKRFRMQARASHQRAVDLLLRHQRLHIFRLHRTPV